MRSTYCLTGAFAAALIALGLLCPVAGAGTGGFGKKFNYQYTVESIYLDGVFELGWRDRLSRPNETWSGRADSSDQGTSRRPVRLPPNNGSGLQNYLPRGGRWRRTPVGRIEVPPYSRAIGSSAAYFRRGGALEDSFFTTEEPDVKFECRTGTRHTLKPVEAQLYLDPEERSESKLFSHPARVRIKWDTQSLIDDIECRNSEGEGFGVAYPREERGAPPADYVRFGTAFFGFYPLDLFRRERFKLEIAIHTAWNLDGGSYIHHNWERDPGVAPPGYNEAEVHWEGEVTLRRTKSLPTK